MPLYDYRCPECGATKEVQHKMDEEVQVLCRHQGNIMMHVPPHKVIMEQVITAPNIIFKGSGFYATDYKGK